MAVDYQGIQADKYDHSTGEGGTFADADPELEAQDFECFDIVAFDFKVDGSGLSSGTTATTSVDLFFDHEATNGAHLGFDHGVGYHLDTTDPAYVDTGTAASISPASPAGFTDNGTDPNGSGAVTLSLDISGVDSGDVIIVRIKVRLGNCGPTDKNSGNVQTGVADVSATDQTGADIGTSGAGQQTVPLKFSSQSLPSIEVKKTLVPSTDSGKFNLKIDGVTAATDVGNGGTTGKQTVLAGDHTVGETAGTGTSLSNYGTTVSCTNGTQTVNFTGPGPHTISVALTEDWVCTITNTRGTPSLTISKQAQDANGGPITTIPLGGSFNYVITVTNTGNASASPVIVTDDLNNSLTINSTSWDVDPPDAGTDGTCTTGAGNTVSCPATGTIILAANDLAANGNDTLRVVINVTVPANLTSCPNLTNSAQVSIGTGTPSTAQSAPVEVTGCAPTLTITKSASSGSVAVNTAFTYTVTVKNTSTNAQATNVVITDDLPNSLTSVSATYNVDPGTAGETACTVGAGNLVTCNVGTLAANNGSANGNDEVVVTIHATTPNSCDQLSNTASVDSDQTTPQSSGDATLVTVTGCAPALTITKEAKTSDGQPITTIGLGGSFKYVIDVTNTGNASASPVIVTDNLDDSLTINSTSWDVNPPDAGTDGTCSVTSGNAVSCPSTGTITLAASDGTPNSGDDTLRVVIIVTVPANLSSCPTLTNSAQVRIGTGNPSTAQSAPVTVTGCAPNLTITKAASSSQVTAGAAFSYTITVKNTGNAPATGVVVTDDLANSLTGVTAGFDIDPGSAGGTGSCTVGAGNTISCAVGTLAANNGATDGPDEVKVTINATAPNTCGQLSNTAHVDWNENTGSDEDSSQVVVTVTGCAPNLTITKEGPATVGQGGAITYTVTVHNSGNASATGVIVTDNLDDSLTNVVAKFDSGESSCNVGNNPNNQADHNYVTCSLGTVGVDETVVIIITANAPRGQCPTITNQASFVTEGGEGDEGTSNIVTTTVTGCVPPSAPFAGIQVVKGGPAVAHVGDTITYTFAVSLAVGSASLTNITISDPICSATPTLVSRTGGNQDTTLETGETWNYSCTHVVTATDPDPLPNTVTVAGTGPNGQVSDTDTHSVDIIHPAIKIVKTAKPTSIGPGDTVTYTYTVTNTGDVTLFDVKVTDNKLGNICTIAQLDVGETETCTADFTASSDFGGPLDNVGKAKGHDVTGFSVQDTDRASIDVVLGTTVTPVTPPSGVAFTGASGVIQLAGLALLLLLLGTGILFLTRRREDGTEA